MVQYIVILGGAICLLGTSIYIRDIFRGRTNPNLVTWVLWAIAPIIASAAAFSKGIYWAALPTFMIGLSPVLVIVASLIKRRMIWKPTIFDYVCGGFSILALIFWIITKEANTAITFAVISDGLAALPTLKKAWLFPETESGMTYIGFLINILSTFPALRAFNYPGLAFPIYNTLLNMALAFAIYRKKIL